MGNVRFESETLEKFLWKGLNGLGIAPRDLVAEGPEVRIEASGAKEIRLPARILCAGISELSRSPGTLSRDWSLEGQLAYLVWKGSRILGRREKG